MWMCGQSGFSIGMCKNPYEWALFHFSIPHDDTGEYFDSRLNIKLSTEFLFDKYYNIKIFYSNQSDILIPKRE